MQDKIRLNFSAFLRNENDFHFFIPGVVRRCGKEKLSYRKEADMQKEKVEKMKRDGREEIEIRKMNEVRLMVNYFVVVKCDHR
jgi:tubulin-specific chaperone A